MEQRDETCCLRPLDSLYVLRDFLRGQRYPLSSKALAVECGGDISGRARATLRCVSQWIHGFCMKSSGIAVKEYGPYELMTMFDGASFDMLEAILTEATNEVQQKQVIIIRDPAACFESSSSLYSGGAGDDDDDDDDGLDDNDITVQSTSDCATGLAVWLSERVPLGVRIVFLLPSGSMLDALGRTCGLIRLSVGEIRDLTSATMEHQDPASCSQFLFGETREAANGSIREGLVCLHGRSGSGKTRALRELKESAISGKVLNTASRPVLISPVPVGGFHLSIRDSLVRIADILAAELGESQRRLRKVYSELASCSKFLPSALIAATFDDCDLWLNSSGKIIREILAQWTVLIDKHGNDILTVITCQDKADLPRALSCRVCKWVDLNDDYELT